MESIGEQMRRESREATRRLSLDGRLHRALEMGELAIEIYCAARQVDRATAIRAFESARQRGRRPCRFLQNAPE